MATTAQYLKSLVRDKHNLVLALQDRGLEASDTETFTELIPKLSTPSTFTITDASYLFDGGARMKDFDNLISRCENVTKAEYICRNNNELTEQQVSQLIMAITPINKSYVYAFSGISVPMSIDLSTVSKSTSINMYRTFYKNTGITYFKMMKGRLSDGTGAFDSCTSIKEVDLSLCNDCMSTSNLFKDCTALERVILPADLGKPLRMYNDYAAGGLFYNCTSLKEITNIEKGIDLGSVQWQLERTFYNCINLYQNEGVLDLSKSIFSSGRYSSEGIYELFYNCRSLKKIILGTLAIDYVQGTAPIEKLFYNCTTLEEVVFTKSITGALSVVKEQFSGCPNLKIIDASAWTFTPDKLSHTFYYCNHLEKLDLSGIDFTDTTIAINTITGNSIPKTCEIILKNQGSVDYFVNAGYTNTHIKEEVQDAT